MAYDTDGLAWSVLSLMHSAPLLGLEEIAGRHGVGRHTVNRALNQVLGKSFRVLRRELQTRRLVELLSESRVASIKELAVAMGYDNAGSLARFSKLSLGVTPSELRRRSSADARTNVASS